MAILKPFRALRFDPAITGDLAAVVAPPYDVIDGTARDRLYARSPYNVVRLILNRDADPYAAAARRFAEWRASGVLAVEARPALYLYAQRFPLAGGTTRERFGIIGALRLEHFETGKVRPHERTLERAKSDRLSLLRACRASLSPIFGLVSDGAWALPTLVPPQPPIIEIADDHGIRHRVWRIDDPQAQAAIAGRLEGKDVFIADGHHRYETALRYRDEVRAALGADAPPAGCAPYDDVLAFLTTLEEPGLVILPTHRLLETLAVDPATLRRLLAEHFTIQELPWNERGKAELRRRLGIGGEAAAGTATYAGSTRGGDAAAGSGRPPASGGAGRLVTIGAAIRGAETLWLLGAAAGALPYAPEIAAPVRGLDVAALHQVVLARVLRLPIGERGGTPGLSYTQDDTKAFEAVEKGSAAAAFFLPPTDVDALRRIGVAGLTMPEKSTYFHPKLLTGLVLYPVDGDPEDAGA